MSVYTNDIDTLRQMISQSMPQLLNSGITIISVFVSMLILSIPLTVVTMIMVGIMVFCSKKSAGQSGAYFAKQQKRPGNCERLYRRDDERTKGGKGILP